MISSIHETANGSMGVFRWTLFKIAFSYELSLNTSDIGLRGDLRSMVLGLLSFGVLLAGCGEETESDSDPGVLSCRAVRGVAGDFLCGTSKEPALPSNSVEWQSEWQKMYKDEQKIAFTESDAKQY